MNLAQLFAAAELTPSGAACEAVLRQEITGIYYRSQDVRPGGLFVAIKGFSADGHDFVDDAVSHGAAAVVSQRPIPADVPVFQLADSRQALADLAAAFFGRPSASMTLIGITGTNGKTTTSYLIESILSAAGSAVGVIGTINYRFAGQSHDNPVTTPESLDLQSILQQMLQAGISHVVMEVSSHALELSRVRGCELDVGIFTNLTQDHLDFHGDMATYWASKKKLFTDLLPAAAKAKRVTAVVNCQDPRGRELLPALTIPFLTTGLTPAENVWAQDPVFTLSGIHARIHTPRGAFAIQSALPGRHNLENILTAAAAAVALDISPALIKSGIEALRRVPGRLDPVLNACNRFVYIDYAHTPDALHNVLSALRDLAKERLICVFGCGGDRDRTKRPLMGGIAAELSDVAIVTSDNPRTETPAAIIDDILGGMPERVQRTMPVEAYVQQDRTTGYLVQPDRRKAIAMAIQGSRPGDTILIAGKGHENYQIIGRQKFPFDDRIEASRALDSLQTFQTNG